MREIYGGLTVGLSFVAHQEYLRELEQTREYEERLWGWVYDSALKEAKTGQRDEGEALVNFEWFRIRAKLANWAGRHEERCWLIDWARYIKETTGIETLYKV